MCNFFSSKSGIFFYKKNQNHSRKKNKEKKRESHVYFFVSTKCLGCKEDEVIIMIFNAREENTVGLHLHGVISILCLN